MQSQEGSIDSRTKEIGEVSSVQGPESNHVLKQPGSPRFIPWWLRIGPFFLSAVFFLSAFFAIFAPLPILFLHLRKGRKWACLAGLTNGVIVALAAGSTSFLFYLVFVVTLSLTLSELLERKKSIERSIGVTLLVMALFGGLFLAGYSHFLHVNPIQEVKAQISDLLDYFMRSMPASTHVMDPLEVDELKHDVLLEFPSAVAITALILVWANLVLVLRANPNGLRERLGLDPAFLKKWKSPELLVWPTIVTGFFLVVDFGIASSISLNIFKFLMAIYALQGLSILSYLFDSWGMRGFFRFLGFVVSIFLMMPLVLSLGFFDLWFDFRGKFRQS